MAVRKKKLISRPDWITVSCHGVKGPMTSRYYCAIFPFCGGGKKKEKKNDKKTKAFYDWAKASSIDRDI